MVSADLLERRPRRRARVEPARLSDRHPAGAHGCSHGLRRRPARRWPPTPRTPSRCTPGTGCTTAGPPRWAGCPPSRTCTRETVTAQPGDRLTLRLTAASDCSDATLNGTVRLRCPRGWAAEPAELTSNCPPAASPRDRHRAHRAGRRRRPATTRCAPSSSVGGDVPDGMAADRRGRLRRDRRRRGARRTGAVGHRAGRRRRRPGGGRPADRHRRHRRPRRPRARGTPDQPVGHLGVDRGLRRAGRCCAPGRRSRWASTSRRRRGWTPDSGGRWSGSAARAGCCTHPP